MRHLLLLCFALCSFIQLFSQEKKQFAVYFETAEAAISPEASAELSIVADYLQQLNDYNLLIEAHTDDRGTVAYNEDLAQRRAATVRDFLERRGLQIEKTTVRSFGEINPAFPNLDDQSRQSNRRVDILVTAIGNLSSLDEVLSHLGKGQRQHFYFAADQAVKITAEGGTTFWIEKNAFQFADGSVPTGEIDFSVREAYSYQDMLAEGLSTSSGNELLETGGMLRLEATADGRPLALKGDQEISVAMPTMDTKSGMQLFMGQAVEGGQSIDWAPTGQEFGTARNVALRMPQRPKMPVNRHYNIAFTPDESGKPEPPVKPREPYQPFKPNREQIKYNPGFVKRVVMGKAKIEAKEEEIFKAKMEEYQVKMTRYEGEMVLYKKNMQQYELDKVNYKVAEAEYKNDLLRQHEVFYESDYYKQEIEKRNQAYNQQLAIYEKKMEAWEELRKQKLAEFENAYAEMGATDNKSLNYYFYNVNQMGWINCDRFYDVPPQEKLMVSIKDAPGDEKMLIIFRDMASMIQPMKDGGLYTSTNLPKGRDITIMSIKLVNGRTFLALKDTQVGAEDIYELEYEPATLRDIREVLTKANG